MQQVRNLHSTSLPQSGACGGNLSYFITKIEKCPTEETGNILRMFPVSLSKKSAKCRLFRIYGVKWNRVMKMLERGKMDRDAIEIVGIDSLVP
ncbi:MAG: hypothetical protein IKU81_08150, partial [Oscillibacter sp.]|nr:hypothetical protein [Oscillibacter sp.]